MIVTTVPSVEAPILPLRVTEVPTGPLDGVSVSVRLEATVTVYVCETVTEPEVAITEFAPLRLLGTLKVAVKSPPLSVVDVVATS